MDAQGALNSVTDTGEGNKDRVPLALRTITAPTHVDNPQPDRQFDINYIINACVTVDVNTPCIRFVIT